MPAPTRWLHLLAGPNGAGKSTLYQALVRDGTIGRTLEFVNADLHERAHLRHITDANVRSVAARGWADARRTELLANGIPFVSETVFSHPSKLTLIDDARRQGFTVALYVVALDDPQRLLARVRQRVDEGGHDVPTDRILARYPRTMTNLAQAVNLADAAYLFDAREVVEGGPYLAAVRTPSRTTFFTVPPPAWVQHMLGST